MATRIYETPVLRRMLRERYTLQRRRRADSPVYLERKLARRKLSAA
jgi:hypothetical protein